MRYRAIKASVAVLAVAGGLLAGCASADGDDAGTTSAATTATSSAGSGVTALEPAEILAKSEAAVKDAKSYTVAGTIKESGQEVTISVSVGGTDLVGNIVIGQGRVDMIRAAGKNYVRPTEAFWAQVTGDAKKAATYNKRLGDKWALVPASDKDFTPLFGVADINSLLTASGSLTKGEEGEIRGTHVIALDDSGADGGTLFVAASGEPYPLRLQSREAKPVPAGESAPATPDYYGLNFTGFGATVDGATTPATTQVINLSEVKG